ncbi:MAG: dockerin type I domain-containing protein, partial [Pirellulales bacterium]
ISPTSGFHSSSGVSRQGHSDVSTTGDVNGDNVSNSADTTIVQSIITAGTNTSLPVRNRRGDYHDDEVVSQLDYMVWKLTFGDILANEPDGFLEADGNGNGVVGTEDYNPWRDNLDAYSAWFTGTPPGSGGGSGGIPIVLFGEAPRVANVTISGSNSTHAPYSFDAHDGSGEQLRTVPVGGADTVSISFTEDVNITADTLRLTGLRTANRPLLAEFSYDIGTMTATWRFTGWALGDQYLISLSDAVTDVEGNPLDGDWTNPIRLSTINAAVSEFPSGDGYVGGDFNFVVTLLPGDANLDLIVNVTDYEIMDMWWWGTPAQFVNGDFNGDGIVLMDDYYLVEDWNLNLSGPISLLADLNGDWTVDELDADILYNNWSSGLQNPTQANGDLDGDQDIDIHDLDLMFAQYGLALNVVS